MKRKEADNSTAADENDIDDDDHDDDNDNKGTVMKGDEEEEDECVSFLRRMLTNEKQHDPHHHPHIRKNATLIKSRKKSPLTVKRLSRRAKMGSIRKMKEFLTLNDPSMRNEKNLALQKSKVTDRPTEHGGAVTTRSASARQRQIDTSEEERRYDDDRASSEKEKRKRRRQTDVVELDKKPRSSSPDSKINDEESVVPIEKSSPPLHNSLDTAAMSIENAQSESLSTRLYKPNDKDLAPIETQSCEFEPNSLILIDDAFCGGRVEAKADRDSMKRQKEEFHEALRFIQCLFLRDAHHKQLHCVVTTQQSLSTSGNSYVAQALRIIRCNMDALVVLPQV